MSLLRARLPDYPGAEEAMQQEQAVRLRALGDLPFVFKACNHLTWAVLLGPVLSESVYRERNHRGFVDLDVLVAPYDYPDAVGALIANGAELLDRNWKLAHGQRRAGLAFRLPSGTLLDLRWSLVDDPLARDVLRLPDLLFAARPMKINGTWVYALSPADNLLHVCLHATLSGGHRLVWVRDIVESMRVVGLTALETRAHPLGLDLVVATALTRAAAVAGTPKLTPTGAWGRLMELTAAQLPPGRAQRPSGAALVAATRTDTRSSARALAKHVTGRTSRRVTSDDRARLVDDGWMDRYLQDVRQGRL